MAFWILVGVLFMVSAVGFVYFEDDRRKNDPNYAPWIYGCALLFAAIPLTTGDTVWSILVLPLALGTAAMIVARRQKKKCPTDCGPPPRTPLPARSGPSDQTLDHGRIVTDELDVAPRNLSRHRCRPERIDETARRLGFQIRERRHDVLAGRHAGVVNG